MTTIEKVILVDEYDNALGEMEKLEAHQKGLLHRAFSVFIFNSKNQLLLQQRNPLKYHSGGLWTNTCCGHPRPNEDIDEAAERRLEEEMGFNCHINKEFTFLYKANFENGLTEHELDHVFIGYYEAEPEPNPDEVSNWKYVDFEQVLADIKQNPQKYTFWFKYALERYKENFLMSIND